MLNEEKVILMTKLASYEKREGKGNMAIGKYFRGDFISLHLLKAVLVATICYFIGFGLYLLYFVEELMAKIYEIDFMVFAKNAISIYVIFVVIYCCLSYVVFTYRFVKAKKGIRRYYHNLKKLSSMSRQ
jgi:hypothetical protein